MIRLRKRDFFKLVLNFLQRMRSILFLSILLIRLVWTIIFFFICIYPFTFILLCYFAGTKVMQYQR